METLPRRSLLQGSDLDSVNYSPTIQINTEQWKASVSLRGIQALWRDGWRFPVWVTPRPEVCQGAQRQWRKTLTTSASGHTSSPTSHSIRTGLLLLPWLRVTGAPGRKPAPPETISRRRCGSTWVLLLSAVWLCDPMTCARQAPPSMGFSRQKYWSGLPRPPPGDLPNPGIKPVPPALQAASLSPEPPRKPLLSISCPLWSF